MSPAFDLSWEVISEVASEVAQAGKLHKLRSCTNLRSCTEGIHFTSLSLVSSKTLNRHIP